MGLFAIPARRSKRWTMTAAFIKLNSGISIMQIQKWIASQMLFSSAIYIFKPMQKYYKYNPECWDKAQLVWKAHWKNGQKLGSGFAFPNETPYLNPSAILSSSSELSGGSLSWWPSCCPLESGRNPGQHFYASCGEKKKENVKKIHFLKVFITRQDASEAFVTHQEPLTRQKKPGSFRCVRHQGCIRYRHSLWKLCNRFCGPEDQYLIYNLPREKFMLGLHLTLTQYQTRLIWQDTVQVESLWKRCMWIHWVNNWSWRKAVSVKHEIEKPKYQKGSTLAGSQMHASRSK